MRKPGSRRLTSLLAGGRQHCAGRDAGNDPLALRLARMIYFEKGVDSTEYLLD